MNLLWGGEPEQPATEEFVAYFVLRLQVVSLGESWLYIQHGCPSNGYGERAHLAYLKREVDAADAGMGRGVALGRQGCYTPLNVSLYSNA